MGEIPFFRLEVGKSKADTRAEEPVVAKGKEGGDRVAAAVGERTAQAGFCATETLFDVFDPTAAEA